jgi:DNA-binding NarL/FixJ family response regulator/tetratricopeptide (TPR) repeat protein
VIRRTAPVLGREPELGALGDALEGCRQGAGVVLVAGEAGSGKTRLIEEFEDRHRDARFVWGGCIEAADSIAYAPWSELLGTLVREFDDGTLGASRSELARIVSGLDAEGLSGGTEGRTLLFDAVVDVLARAANEPLVCVVEDMQWIDTASHDLLISVLRRLRRLPVLFVATYRSEGMSARVRELLAQLARSSTRISLDQLSDEAARDIITALVGDNLDDAEREAIVARAAGNPLFIEELAYGVGEVLPVSLRDVLLARFNALAEDPRRLVRTAAVIGVRVPRAWLVTASGISPERARSSARDAADAGVLIPDEARRGYAFRHGLLREAILDDLLPDDRVLLHRSAAAALETRAELQAEVDRVAELARHWDLAEQPAQALVWTSRAGQQAMERYAFESAAALYERALVWWPAVEDAAALTGMTHITLVMDAADANGDAGNLDRAADLVRQALVEAEGSEPSTLISVTGRSQRHLWAAGRIDDFSEFSSVALAQLDRVDALTRAEFLTGYVDYLAYDGRAPNALALVPRLLETIEQIDDRALEANAHQIISLCYEIDNDFDHMIDESDKAIDIARRYELHGMLALALYNRASSLQSFGESSMLLSVLDELDGVIVSHNVRRLIVPAATLRTTELCVTGDLAGAKTVLGPIAEIATEGVERQELLWARAVLAYHSGAVGDARDLLVGALNVNTDFGRALMMSRVYADALAWKGELRAAREVLAEKLADLKGRVEPYLHALVVGGATRIEADIAEQECGSEFGEARARIASMLDAWKNTYVTVPKPFPLVSAMNLAVLAEAARVNGADAIDATATAADAFGELDRPYSELYFRWRNARARIAVGDRDGARQVLADARIRAGQRGFGTLTDVIAQTARTEQLRLGPGNTSVDGERALSERELDVLRLLELGRSNPDIGEELVISRHTVRAHVSKILDKLEASSRTEAVAIAHRRGIL